SRSRSLLTLSQSCKAVCQSVLNLKL
ncbi:ATP-dependent protease HslVU, ATPase subunit, partial [Vibrio parahaemolyticus V-223/04]